MKTKKVPNPGSEEAGKLGCCCPVLDNSRGKGYLGMKGIFVQNGNCKIHGLKNQKTVAGKVATRVK